MRIRIACSLRGVPGALVLAGLVLVAMAGPGCESIVRAKKERQLQNVARDWAMTIRASQVVPVYPLSQDMIPGDVYLVQESVRRQGETFKERGFLPIDMHVRRLAPKGFNEFYKHYVPAGASAPTNLPRDWRVRDNAADSWAAAPRAGFPSYSFRASASGGLSLAVPVQSVPVGLSLLGASRATGTVTITDAFTYGLGVGELDALVRADDQMRSFLSRLEVPEGQTYYLRVITRVFGTKNLTVTITADSSSGGGIDIGVAKDVASASPGTTPAPAAGGAGSDGITIDSINTALESIDASLPGGSFRAVSGQGRSISFTEGFDEPIIFGYHGFDVAIGPGGSLGPVVPTFRVLDAGQTPPAATALDAHDLSYLAMLAMLRSIETKVPTKVDAVLRAAASRHADFATEYASRSPVGTPNASGGRAWVSALGAFTGGDRSTGALRARLDNARAWLAESVANGDLDLP